MFTRFILIEYANNFNAPHPSSPLDMLHSNRKGLNARGLIECISSGKYSTAVESSGDSFRELVDGMKNNSITNLDDYLKSLQLLAIRLKFVEHHGYSSAKEVTGPSPSSQETISSTSTSQKKNTETTSKSKKKKKKKKDSLAPKTSGTSTNLLNAPPRKPATATNDPLVSALLAMGFSNEQIDAAVLAFGGTDRVTADDMVVWILERESNGGIGSDPSTDNAVEDAKSTHISQEQIFDAEDMQRRAEEQAKKDAEEALKKVAEKKAAAERQAAKREEQRRIRREWNNREQIRQQEEAHARLADEVQRRKQIESEKAKAKAQRVAEERAAPSALSQAIGMSALESVGVSNAGSVPLFSSGVAHSLGENQSILSAQSVDQTLLPTTVGPPGIPPIATKTPPISNARSSSKSPKNANKSQRKNRRLNKNTNSPKSNKQSNASPMRQTSLVTDKSAPSMIINDSSFPASYDSNPLGEIRATAREFVPSFAPASTLPPKPMPAPQSAPPGLGLDDQLQAEKISEVDSIAAGLSILPPQGASSLDLDSSSSILPNLERSALNSSSPFPRVPGLGLDRSSSAPANRPREIDIATSSISGLSLSGSNFMPDVSNVLDGGEDELVSSILNASVASLDSHTHSHTHQISHNHNPLNSLGGLPVEPSNGNGSSLLWGAMDNASGASSSSNIGGLSTFGFASQVDNASTSFSSIDGGVGNIDKGNEKKDSTNSNTNTSTWGSFGPSSGGSIW